MPSRFTTCMLPVQTRHPCTCTVEWCTVCMSKHSATAIRRVLRQQAVLPQARGQAPTWELVMPGRHGAGSIPFSPAHVCVAAKHMRLTSDIASCLQISCLYRVSAPISMRAKDWDPVSPQPLLRPSSCG